MGPCMSLKPYSADISDISALAALLKSGKARARMKIALKRGLSPTMSLTAAISASLVSAAAKEDDIDPLADLAEVDDLSAFGEICLPADKYAVSEHDHDEGSSNGSHNGHQEGAFYLADPFASRFANIYGRDHEGHGEGGQSHYGAAAHGNAGAHEHGDAPAASTMAASGYCQTKTAANTSEHHHGSAESQTATYAGHAEGHSGVAMASHEGHDPAHSAHAGQDHSAHKSAQHSSHQQESQSVETHTHHEEVSADNAVTETDTDTDDIDLGLDGLISSLSPSPSDTDSVDVAANSASADSGEMNEHHHHDHQDVTLADMDAPPPEDLAAAPVAPVI